MSYYRGDVYGFRGDYYRGDLFSFIGKALGGVAKIATGFLTGGPAGGIGAAVNLIRRPTAPVVSSFGPTLPGGGLNIPPSLELPGAPSGSYGGYVTSSAAIPSITAVGSTGRRMHPNKSAYATRGGGTSRWPRGLVLHAKGTVLVPSRRRNVGNARALRHALSRVAGFAHLARKVMSFVHPRAGRGHFKFPKRKRLKA